MNQYPTGFLPMAMVPTQPYMVAMPAAIPMSGAVGPGLQALPHQVLLLFHRYFKIQLDKGPILFIVLISTFLLALLILIGNHWNC